MSDSCVVASDLVQLGVNNSIVILSFNAQLPECFASDYAPIGHLDQGTEKKQLSIYLRRETLGTGGCKTLVVNSRCEVITSAQAEYPTAYPHPGWREQNPEDWLDAVGKTVDAALKSISHRLTAFEHKYANGQWGG